jgi:hypothetical protein
MHRPDERPWRTEFEARHPEVLDAEPDRPGCDPPFKKAGCDCEQLRIMPRWQIGLLRDGVKPRPTYPPRYCGGCGIRLNRYNPGPLCYGCTEREAFRQFLKSMACRLRQAREERS